jgi:uncharacterized protein
MTAMRRLLLPCLLVLCASAVHAQPSAAAAAATAKPVAQMNKGELVARFVQLQQGQVQAVARNIIESPVQQMLAQVGGAVQRLPAEGREAVAKDVQAEVRKYFDDVGPILRDSIQRLAGPTIAPLLEERLTEDDLRQLITIFESPALRKYEQMAPDLQRQLAEKLLADARPKLEERFRTLGQSVSRRLSAAAPPAGGASAPRRP